MSHKTFLAIGLTGTALLCSVALIMELPRLLAAVLLFLFGVGVSWQGAARIKAGQTLDLQGRVLTGLAELYPAQSSSEVVPRVREMLQRLLPAAEVEIYAGLDPETYGTTEWKEALRRVRQGIADDRTLILTGQEGGPEMPCGVSDLAILPFQKTSPQALLLINAGQSAGLGNLQAVLGILHRHAALVLGRLQEEERRTDMAQNLLAASITAMEGRAGHAERVARISRLIGERLGMNREELTLLNYAALLHDIGKWTLPEDREGDHAAWGAGLVPAGEAFTRIRAAIRHHHESYDGHGGPERLKHTEIPLEARIIAVADAYDALTGPGAEEERRGRGPALAAIKKAIGTRFDPLVVIALEEVAAETDEPVTG